MISNANKAIDRPWFGASWKIAAFVCYAGLNAIARYLSGGAQSALPSTLPVPVIVFFQDLIALTLLIPWMVQRRQRLFPIRNIRLNIARVVMSAIAINAWYFALVYMPLPEAVALSIIGPILGVIGAKWFLKEKLGWLKGAVIGSAFVGAWLIIKPDSVLLENSQNVKGLFFIALSSLSFAIAKILTRKLAMLGESQQNLTFYLFVFIVPISFLPAAIHWATPSFAHLPWLFLAGGLTALAIFCVSSALVYAEVCFLAPFDMCQFLLNTSISYFAFRELPAPWAIWLVLAFVGFSLTLRKKSL